MAKYYRFDYKGNILADKTFDELDSLSIEYYSARKGKKMGIVKTVSLEVIVDFLYDKYENYVNINTWEINNEKTLFKVHLDGKVLIIDENNNVLQAYSYKYIHKEKDFIITYLDKLMGIINKSGVVLFEPRFSSCQIISNNRILAKEGDFYFIYDENGKLLKSVEASYIRHVLPDIMLEVHFEKNGKHGLFDDDFNVIIENKYDEINIVNDNFLFVRNVNQSVVLNKHNDIVKEFDFPFVLNKAVKIKNGTYNYVVAKDKSYESKLGLLNDKFELVVPIEYNWFEYNDDVWIVRKGRSEFLYGMDFKEIKGVKYKEIGRFEPTGISCTVDDEGKYRFIDYTGKIINDLIFDRVYLGSRSTLDRLFSQGLLGVRINGKWGFINDRGEIVLDFIYEHIMEFDTKKNAIVKKNGKWGLINTKGEVIIDFLFDSFLNYNLDHKVIKSQKDNLFGLIDFNNQIIIPHLADSLWLCDGYIDVRSKKSVFKKQNNEKKSTTAVKEKVKVIKPAEPILLLEKKFVKFFDSLNHPDIVRAMLLSVAEESGEGYFKIYMIDFVKRDGTSATYINGYAGGGEWESYEFNNETIYEGGNDGISAFHMAQDDEIIHSLIKNYLSEFDEDADEYRFKNLDYFEKTGAQQLMVLNAVWFEKDFDYTNISQNDKKRVKNLLKQTGLLWKKWNFKF